MSQRRFTFFFFFFKQRKIYNPFGETQSLKFTCRDWGCISVVEHSSTCERLWIQAPAPPKLINYSLHVYNVNTSLHLLLDGHLGKKCNLILVESDHPYVNQRSIDLCTTDNGRTRHCVPLGAHIVSHSVPNI